MESKAIFPAASEMMTTVGASLFTKEKVVVHSNTKMLISLVKT